MRLELALARATNEKTQVEGLKRSLEEEVIRLQSRLQAIEYYLMRLHFSVPAYGCFQQGNQQQVDLFIYELPSWRPTEQPDLVTPPSGEGSPIAP